MFILTVGYAYYSMCIQIIVGCLSSLVSLTTSKTLWAARIPRVICQQRLSPTDECFELKPFADLSMKSRKLGEASAMKLISDLILQTMKTSSFESIFWIHWDLCLFCQQFDETELRDVEVVITRRNDGWIFVKKNEKINYSSAITDVASLLITMSIHKCIELNWKCLCQMW